MTAPSTPLQEWGAALWGGPTLLPAEPLGQQFPPPIPEATTTQFDYVVNIGSQSWGVDGWGVPREDPSFPGGGVLLAPRPDNGVMRVFAWWPDATLIHLIRVHPDGSRWPVRGGTPRQVKAATRRNFDQNPSGEAAINGLFPGPGDPVFDRVVRDGAPDGGQWAIANDIAAAGASGLSRPIAAMAITQRAITVSFDALFTALPSSVTVSVDWQDATGATGAAVTTATLGADELVQSVGQWGRQYVHLTPPDDAAAAIDVDVTADGLPAGRSFTHDRWVLEEGHTDGSFISGITAGGLWLGVPELSASLVAEVQTVDDGECPLDLAVTYELFYAGVTGGLMRSRPETLPARRGHAGVWLTHPRWPDRPIALWLARDPKFTRPIDRSASKVMGRKRKVVRSDDQRGADEGSLTIHTEGEAGSRALSDVLDDGRSVLLRVPAGWQHPPLRWLSFADIDIDNPRGDAPYYRREWTLPFDEVDPPNAIDFSVVA